jgi:dihydrodipicolinate synthase/N-acetylneuraminate lyase
MSIYKEKFSGVFPAVLTPINKDLSCNYDELANHINELINAGCKGGRKE